MFKKNIKSVLVILILLISISFIVSSCIKQQVVTEENKSENTKRSDVDTEYQLYKLAKADKKHSQDDRDTKETNLDTMVIKEFVTKVEETTLIDNDVIKLVAKRIDKGFLHYNLDVSITNKTDKEIILKADDVSVDGVIYDGFMTSNVAPNETKEDSIGIIGISTLENIEIYNFGVVEASIVVMNEEWESIAEDVNIKLETNMAGKLKLPEYKGIVIENDEVKVTFLNDRLIEVVDSAYLPVILENKSDSEYTFSIDSFITNEIQWVNKGIEKLIMTGILFENMGAKSRKYTTVFLDANEFSQKKVGLPMDVQNISLAFSIRKQNKQIYLSDSIDFDIGGDYATYSFKQPSSITLGASSDEDGHFIDIGGDLIYEDDNVSMKLDKINFSSYKQYDVGPTVEVLVENKSDDSLSIYLENPSINDFHLPTVYMTTDVPPKEVSSVVLPIVSEHFLSDVAELGNVEKVGFRISAYAMESEYACYSDEYIYKTGKNFTLYEPKNIQQVGTYKNLQLSYLQKSIYETEDRVLIPIYYKNDTKQKMYISAKNILVDGKKVVVDGHQLIEPNSSGIAECYVLIKNLENTKINSFDLNIGLFNIYQEELKRFNVFDNDVQYIKKL